MAGPFSEGCQRKDFRELTILYFHMTQFNACQESTSNSSIATIEIGSPDCEDTDQPA